MPKKYARIFLEVTSVEIEKLRDMEWPDLTEEEYGKAMLSIG